ncbi:zf-HC2 domain-containing protein [Candidatus Bipolaricaulota bacterium]|nr:zf-HC2 domain-containing protein [Candidatus Bipolaricaulota bacterium]
MSVENRNQESFERTLLGALDYEITPAEGACTCDVGVLVASLAGELSMLEEDRLAAHLIVCPACAKEYASLERSLQQETERLTSEARVPSLASQMRPKRQNEEVAWRYLWNTLRSVLPRGERQIRGAMGLALAGLVLALSVVLPLHYLGGGSATIIAGDGQMIAKGEQTIESTDAAIVALTPRSLVDKLDSLAGYEPWRATAFVIGYLRAAGIPLDSASLVFEHQTTYITQSGDTWRTVAQEALADGDLWPIIILLNHNRTQHGEFPPVGTILRIPALAQVSK